MTINEERDIILNALYKHFCKHRINYLRLLEYLEHDTDISVGRIDIVTEDLVSSGYVGKVMNNQFHDYWILPKGETLIEEHGGFTVKQQKDNNRMPASIHVNTGGGAIIGSAVGNQASLRLEGESVHAIQVAVHPIVPKISMPPTDKPEGWLKKFIIWCMTNIGKIIIGLLILAIGWYIQNYLDKSYGVIQSIPHK